MAATVAAVAAVAGFVLSVRWQHAAAVASNALCPFLLLRSFASLYQKPRDEPQDAAFGRALGCVRGSRGRPHTPSNVRTR